MMIYLRDVWRGLSLLSPLLLPAWFMRNRRRRREGGGEGEGEGKEREKEMGEGEGEEIGKGDDRVLSCTVR